MVRKLVGSLVTPLLAFLFLAQGCASLEPANFFSGTRPKDYLTAKDYRHLTFNILYAQYCPLSGTTDLLNMANKHCNKPDGIALEENSFIPAYAAPAKSWNDKDIRDLVATWTRLRTVADRKVFNVVFLLGHYEKFPEFAGVAIDHDLVAIFPERTGYASTVPCHEFGHCLGLCNNGVPAINRKHIDKDHSGHCINPGCLMFWLTTASSSFELDQDCLGDIREYLK